MPHSILAIQRKNLEPGRSHPAELPALRMPIPLRAGLVPEPSRPLEIMEPSSEILIANKCYPCLFTIYLQKKST